MLTLGSRCYSMIKGQIGVPGCLDAPYSVKSTCNALASDELALVMGQYSRMLVSSHGSASVHE
jgi:hypothetical protein